MNKGIKNIIILIIILGSIIGVKEYLSKRVSLEELLQNNEVTEPVTSTFALMLEQSDGTYKESKSTKWPSNMKYNSKLSKCIDVNGNIIDNALSYDSDTKLVTVRTTKTAYCNVYFDKDSSVYAKVIDDYLNNNGVNKLSDSDKGNREYDTFYYTRDVTNNNVLYANHCWKMIITTEGKGVKMLYNGVPTNGSCDNSGDATTIGESAFNSSSNSPAYAGYMYNKVYTATNKYMETDTTEYVYGNSVTWDGSKYTLVDTKSGSWSSVYNQLDNNHYTCFTTGKTCSSVYYIYFAYSRAVDYIILTGGVNIEEALNEMLYAEDVNTKDSTIKEKVDSWYESNLLNTTDSNGNKYSSYLQNTIYCNNREIKALGAFNPNGGSTIGSTSYMWFNSSSLDCENKNDQFTLSVDNGGTAGYGNNALKYPIGLISDKEAKLAPISGYLDNNSFYWVLSPSCFRYSSALGHRLNDNYYGETYLYSTNGVRPALTLSNNIEITLGDGSVNNPYVVGLA